MKCPDCKGSGVYQGLGAPEPCQRCSGRGEDVVKITTVKPDIPDEPWPGGVNKKHWDALRDLYEKHGGAIQHKPNQKASVVGRAAKAGMSPKQVCEDTDQVISLTKRPIEGEVVHVYDAGWYEATIVSIYDGGVRGVKMVRADHACGTFRIPIEDICWNVTERRWEHIRFGTPVW